MALSQRSRTVLPCIPQAIASNATVRLILAAKGVVYDLVVVNPRSPPEDLLDLNPYNSVPTLVDRDLVLYTPVSSANIWTKRYPHPPLDAGRSAVAAHACAWRHAHRARLVAFSSHRFKPAAGRRKLRANVCAKRCWRASHCLRRPSFSSTRN